jgi:hypothetical protein
MRRDTVDVFALAYPATVVHYVIICERSSFGTDREAVKYIGVYDVSNFC